MSSDYEITTHGGFPGWKKVDISQYLGAVGSLAEFAERYIGHSNLNIALLYNFTHRRVDFRAIDKVNRDGVNIYFEPGHPVDDLPESSYESWTQLKKMIQDEKNTKGNLCKREKNHRIQEETLRAGSNKRV
ncbi:hypothetical protein PROFUN_03892 [Planoprotostelium fungivorum]|uniref:Uncharacterized protein n=1 Tax=Planoprotostelium fungivorum TaxID=1890364 RepID=A0A2P6MTR8_9EUKA|nr:hypothetical protein PROFUN_03892 [Planoprotostelium fungivorum]